MVTIDGSLYSFGRNDSGQLGLGNYDDNIGIPRKARVDEPVISVSCGDLHTVILTLSGTVYTCGGNWDAQLGHGDRDLIRYLVVPKPLPLESPCTFVASGGWHNFVILRNGKVYVWGNGTTGELGTGVVGDDDYLYYPTLLKFEGTVQSIGAGFSHSALLTSDGSVYTCGDVDGITAQSTFVKVM
jgi:alpha-tubulin suppressor-like RCC1 family protein